MTQPRNLNPVDTTVTEVYQGLATAILQPRGFSRKLLMLSVYFSEIVRFDVYIGGIAPASRVAGHPNGDINDGAFPHPVHVPGGNAVYVVWQSATGTGGVRAQFDT